MRVREPRQIDECFDTRMMPVRDRRVERLPCPMSDTVQQRVECRCGARIRGQACVPLTDRVVGLLLVMPNETFSRRHDVLPSFLFLDLQVSTARAGAVDGVRNR